MYVNGFVRGKGKFIESIATDEKTGPRFPLLLTTGHILSRSNVGAQKCGTANSLWHKEDLLEIHPARRGKSRHPRPRLGAARLASPRARRRRARKSSIGAGRGRNDVPSPDTQANVITTDYSDWATNCPEYTVTAVQVSPSNGSSRWQEDYEKFSRQSRIAVGRICGVNA
jgi:formate dehydrogenase major subunit